MFPRQILGSRRLSIFESFYLVFLIFIFYYPNLTWILNFQPEVDWSSWILLDPCSSLFSHRGDSFQKAQKSNSWDSLDREEDLGEAASIVLQEA